MKWNPFNNSRKKQEEADRLTKERQAQERANQLLREQNEKREMATLLEKYCTTWQSGFYTKADELNWDFSPTTLDPHYNSKKYEVASAIIKIKNFVLTTKLETKYSSLKSWALTNKSISDDGKVLTVLDEKILGVGRDNAGRAFHQDEIIWRYGAREKNTFSLLKNTTTPVFPINKELNFIELDTSSNFESNEFEDTEISLYLRIVDSIKRGEKLWVCYDDDRLKFEPIISQDLPCSSEEEFRKKVQDFKVSDLAYWEYVENLYNTLPPELNVSVALEIDKMSVSDSRDVRQNLVFIGKERAVEQRPQGKREPIHPLDGYTAIYTSKFIKPTEEDIERFNSIKK